MIRSQIPPEPSCRAPQHSESGGGEEEQQRRVHVGGGRGDEEAGSGLDY